jgi:hypothetical protein
MCDASCGALLIAKHDMADHKVRKGDMFVCARSYTPQYGRGRINILNAPDADVLRFVNRAWYRRSSK